MIQSEFIRKVLHKPWQNRQSSFECCDCFGLVMLYYKEVLSITIPEVKGFTDNTDFLDCYLLGINEWEEVSTPYQSGLMFTSYKGDSAEHVGICIGGGKVLHSRGDHNNGGKIQIHSMSAIKAIFGKVTFHKFKG